MMAWIKKYGASILILAIFKPWFSYPLVALSVLAAGYGLGRTARMFFDFLWGG